MIVQNVSAIKFRMSEQQGNDVCYIFETASNHATVWSTFNENNSFPHEKLLYKICPLMDILSKIKTLWNRFEKGNRTNLDHMLPFCGITKEFNFTTSLWRKWSNLRACE